MLKGSILRMCGLLVGLALGADVSWTGAARDGKWSTAANWSDARLPQPGDTVHLSNNVENVTIDVDVAGGVAVGELRFEGEKSLTLRGEKITISSTWFNLAGPNPKPSGANNLRDYTTSRAGILGYYAGAIIHNEVEFSSAAVCGVVATANDFHFHGAVTAPNATDFRIHAGIAEEQKFSWNLAYPETEHSVNFHGAFQAPKANVTCNQYPVGAIVFGGPTVAKNIGGVQWTSCNFIFQTDDVTVTDGALNVYYGSRATAGAVDAFPANAVFMPRLANNMDQKYAQSFYLSSYDQTIDRLAGELFNSASRYNNNGNVYGSSVLTLKGTADAVTPLRVCDSVSVVWDPIDNFTQSFTGRVHTTTGSLTVKGGTVALIGETKFADLAVVRVGAGATLADDSTVAGSFANVAKVNVQGLLRFGTSAVTPFSGGRTFIFVEGNGRVEVPSGMTVSVRNAFVNGTVLTAGTYAEGWVTGGGSVTVAENFAGTMWQGTVGESWNTASAWSAGLPNETKKAYFMRSGDESVALDAAFTTVPGDLEVDKESGTTTFNVTAPVAFTTGRRLSFGKGTRIVVPTGGAYVYDGSLSTNNKDAEVVGFRDGAVIEVNGGAFSLTNMTGQTKFGTSESAQTNLIKVTDGLLSFYRTGSNAAGGTLVVSPNLRIEATGGVVSLGSSIAGAWCQGFGHANARLDQYYSGTATLRKVNASSGAMFVTTMGPGVTRFGGNSVYAIVKAPGAGNFREDIKASDTVPAEVIFEDQVTVSGRIGDDGLYIYGTTAQPASLTWGASTSGLLAAGVTLFNNAHVYVTNGVLKVENYGFTVGSNSGDKSTIEVNGGKLWLHTTFRMQGLDGMVLGYGLAASSGTREGTLILSDGVISNTCYSCFNVGAGYGAKGTLRQTGGVLVSTPTKKNGAYCTPSVIGLAGGTGLWQMQGGVASLDEDLWIGGCPTNRYGQIFLDWSNQPVFKCPGYNGLGATGTLEISGGTMTVNNTVTVGAGHSGTIRMLGGSLTVKELALSNNTESVLAFVPSDRGVGTLSVQNKITVVPGSKVKVDATAYSGNSVTLVSWNAIEGSFAESDLELEASDPVYRLVVSETGIRLMASRGTTLTLR